MSDIFTKVIAIQGNAVVDAEPSDGYVLTWDESGDGYWMGKTPQKFGDRQFYFTEDGYWTCPADITSVLVVGCGGGGAGAGTVGGGFGGGGALQQITYITVTPNVVYTITVGSGGTANLLGENGNDGNPTIITDSVNTVFYAVGGAGAVVSGFTTGPGTNFAGSIDISGLSPSIGAATGGRRSTDSFNGNGNRNYVGGYAGGLGGIYININGGGGGGAGPQGSGADGGNGVNPGVGEDGNDAAPNTGAGGGGGGFGSDASGTGGNGGSGYLYIIY